MNLAEKFPPLYTCSVCGKGVKVIPQREGKEPLYEYHKTCNHRNVTIYANRKVTLRGKGTLNPLQEVTVKFTISARQLLSWLTGRSI
ncbi:hypothetical protein CCP3SC1AL1_350009 [Gammaproteobacteria bacterium]